LSDPYLLRYHRAVAQRKAVGMSWDTVGLAYSRLFERIGRPLKYPLGVIQPQPAAYTELEQAVS
jgi:hypothetical protein